MLNRSTLLLVLSLVPTAVSAQSPSTVSVRVELVFPRYRNHYSDRTAVEATLAKRFTEHLSRKFGFLRFATDETSSPYHLTLKLDRADRNAPATGLSELGFWARLDGPDVGAEKYWLPFRGGTLVATPTPEAFETELATKLAISDSAPRIEEVLKQVPMSETALPSPSPLGWALPFRQLELCMRNQSVLKFFTEVQAMEHVVDANLVGAFPSRSGLPTEHQQFVGNAFARNLDLPVELKQSITDGTLRVKRVMVTTYIHDATACDNRLPGSGGTGGTP
jgi:hypothetical protein